MITKKYILRFFVLVPIFIFSILVLLLSIKYSPTYVYRLITMNVADVYDYRNFDNHRIQGAKRTNQFISLPEEVYVESKFDQLITNTGFDSFEEWAIASQTTALIVIQRDTLIYEKYFNGFDRDVYFHSQSMANSCIRSLKTW